MTAGHAETCVRLVRRPSVADRAECLAEAELADHLGGQGGRGGQVVRGTGGRLAADEPLGGPAAQLDGEGFGQVALPVQPPVVGWEQFGEPEGVPAPSTVTRPTGSACGDRAATRACPASCTATVASSSSVSVTVRSLVPSSTRSRASVKSAAVSVVPAAPDRGQRRLVDQVGQVGAGEPRSGGGDLAEVDVGREVLTPGVEARMAPRSGRLGSGTRTSRSNRPGRRSAGSRACGRLVAASTTTQGPGRTRPSRRAAG